MNKLKGFTLIEIVIAIALMTALSGVFLAAYNGYNKKQAVQTATDRISQVFAEARANSMAGKKDCYVCGGVDHACDNQNDGNLTSWEVVINPTAGPGGVPPAITNGYRIQGHCFNLSGGTPTDLTFMSRDQQFPDNLTISTLAGSPDAAKFQPLNGRVEGLESRNMYVNLTGGDSTGGFMVTAAGEIKPQDPTPTPTLIPTAAPTNTPVPTPSTCSGHCEDPTWNCYPVQPGVGSCPGGQKCWATVASHCGVDTCYFTGSPSRLCRVSACSGAYHQVTGYICPSGYAYCCSL